MSELCSLGRVGESPQIGFSPGEVGDMVAFTLGSPTVRGLSVILLLIELGRGANQDHC